MPYFKNTGFVLITSLAFNLALAAEETEYTETNIIEQPTGALEATNDISSMPEQAKANDEFSIIDEQTETNPSDNSSAKDATSQEVSPRIRAQYYSAEAIQAIPRLKPLAKQEPDHHKILLNLEGYPKHEEIILEIQRLGSADPKAYDQKVSFTIEDNGTMLIKGTEQRLQTIISHSSGYLPGERVTYRFRTADGAISKEISGVPTPAILRNKNNEIILKAELASVNPTAYKISLPMLDEGEQYDLKSTSVGSIVRAKPKYSKNKPFVYSPAAGGNSKGGDAILEIKRKSGQTYAIRLPWGSALEGYYSGKKVYATKP